MSHRQGRKKEFTLSVWPGAAARTFPLLQSHTQIVFLESKPTDTKHCREKTEKEHHGTEWTESALFTNHCTTNLTASIIAWQTTKNGLITATRRNWTVVQPLALAVCTFGCFLLEEPPIADRVSGQQHQSSRKEDSRSYGNPSPRGRGCPLRLNPRRAMDGWLSCSICIVLIWIPEVCVLMTAKEALHDEIRWNHVWVSRDVCLQIDAPLLDVLSCSIGGSAGTAVTSTFTLGALLHWNVPQ